MFLKKCYTCDDMKTKTILLIILGLALVAVIAFFTLMKKAPENNESLGENLSETEKAEIVESVQAIIPEPTFQESVSLTQDFLAN